MIQEQYIDSAGKIRILWQSAQGNSYLYKFDEVSSLEELVSLGDTSDLLTTINSEAHIKTEFDLTAVADFIQFLLDNPDTNHSEFTTYVNAQSWWVENSIRYFVFAFTSRLVELQRVVLEGETEAYYLRGLREFIHSKPEPVIRKIILNQT